MTLTPRWGGQSFSTGMIRYTLLGIALAIIMSACKPCIQTVNPNASREAKELLRYFYDIKGEAILAGQHHVIGKMSEVNDRLYALTGKLPVLWGSDFGFADSTHDIDNIAYRPLLVPEIQRQHAGGAIITLTYHQANPVAGEPCQFKGGVISELSDEQWEELTTEGTPLYEDWRKQMDLLADHLKKLEDLKIPVLFRPYHEMNGSWFWWGGRPGEEGFISLWKQLFHYYTDVHGLNNLIWVWSPDNPKHGFKPYYPGDDYVDMVACDIYPKKDTNVVYTDEIYQQLSELAGTKPMGIGECSILPDSATLEQQPGWCWFLAWGGMVFRNENQEILELYQYSRTKFLKSE